MFREIDEAKDLLEKAEKETIIMEKRELFTDGMEILDKCLDNHDTSDIAKEIKREHIQMFLKQLIELPSENVDDIMDIMEMVDSMGTMLFEIIENEMETYKSALEQLMVITCNYHKFIMDCNAPLESIPIIEPILSYN